MKTQLCLALVILAVLPAAAQNAASPRCSANAETATNSAQDYAAQVDGLLRDVHTRLHSISVQQAAGSLTLEQARELKLAATRDTISRLDTLAAVFDAQLDSKSNCMTERESAVADASEGNSATRITRNSSTVSVEELKREGMAAIPAPRAEETTR